MNFSTKPSFRTRAISALAIAVTIASAPALNGEIITAYFRGTGTINPGASPSPELSFEITEGQTFADPTVSPRTRVSSGGGTEDVSTPLTDARLEVGRLYTISVTTNNVPGVTGGPSVHWELPPGYQWKWNEPKPAALGDYSFRILPDVIDDIPTPAGQAESFSTSPFGWGVSLGRMHNGTSAGSLRLDDVGFESVWNDIFTPSGLGAVTNLRLQMRNPVSGGIHQVKSAEALAHLEVVSSTKYRIKFYKGSEIADLTNRTDHLELYDTSGKSPFVVYTLEKPGSSATELKITQEIYGDTTSVQRTEVTTIKRTGTFPNYDWEIKDWNKKGSSQIVQQNDDWETTTDTDPETTYVYKNNYELKDVSTSTVVSEGQRVTGHFSWGESVVKLIADPTGANLVTDYEYYTDLADPDEYSRVKKITYPDGGYEEYAYYGLGEGGYTAGGFEVTRPFQNSTSGGVVSKYWLEPSLPSYPQRLQKVEHWTSGTLTNKTEFTHEQWSGESSTVNRHYLVRTTRKDWYANGSNDYQTTISQYYSGRNEGLIGGRPFSIQRPDDTKTVYAYHSGSWNGTTFTSGTGDAFRTVEIHGTIDTVGSTAYTTYDGYDLVNPKSGSTSFRVVDGKSTMEVTIRNSRGLVARSETHVRSGGSWIKIGHTNFVYNDRGLLTSRTSDNGATYTTEYSQELLHKRIDAAGTEVIYPIANYDAAGRPGKMQRAASGGTVVPLVETAITYDAAGRVLTRIVGTGSEQLTTSQTYDKAGRVTSFTTPNEGSTSVAYTSGGKVATYTLPTTKTRIETRHNDGSLDSITGTGVVAQYVDRTVESSGQIKTTARVGSSSSSRLNESWTDWLGRTVKTSRPALGGGSFITESIYNSAGELFQSKRTGYSDTRYSYDNMGQLELWGVDVSNGGSLVEASLDRLTKQTVHVESFDSAYWQVVHTYGYFGESGAGFGTPTRLSTTRTRLTGFAGSAQYEARYWDADFDEGTASDFTSKTVVTVDRNGKNTTETTTVAGISTAAVSVYRNGLPVSTKGHNGATYTSTFDALGRLKTLADPRTDTATRTYKADTTLVSSVSRPIYPSGTVSVSYVYDSAGRLTKITDEAGQTNHSSYDDLSRVHRQWGSARRPVEFGYDATYGDRTTLKTYRDGNGWAGTTWPGGGTADTTTWNFDTASGMMHYKTAADTNAVVYSYEADGRVKQREWVRRKPGSTTEGVKTIYDYDNETGELTDIDYNDGTTSTDYTYNRAGQLKTAAKGSDSRTFNYNGASPWQLEYESLGALYGGLRLGHFYQTTGLKGRAGGYQLGTSGDPDRDLVHTWGYEATSGRLNSVLVNQAGSTARSHTYGYTANSNLLHTTTVGGSDYQVTYGWDAKSDWLTNITATRGTGASNILAKFEYEYTDRGRRDWEKRSGNSFNLNGSEVTVDYTYNDRGELTSAHTYNGTDSDIGTSSLEIPNLQHDYDYDNAGNRIEANQTGNAAYNETATTHATNRLSNHQNKAVIVAGTVGSGSNVAVAMDGGSPVGPARESAYYSHAFTPANSAGPAISDISIWAGAGSGAIRSDTKTQAIAQATQTLDYDFDGNLTNDGLWDYTWDAENRLIAASTTSAAETAGMVSTDIVYTYDYMGRRIERTVDKPGTGDDTHHRYAYDGWNLLAEYTVGGDALTLVRSYAWGVDERGRHGSISGAGTLLQITDHGTNMHYVPAYDGNGNLVALYDAADESEEAVYEYSPYGELLRATGAYAQENPFGYATKLRDEHTGLVNYGYRNYSPKQGRFINRDPIEEAGGVNLYAFTENDPVNQTDILGLSDWRGGIYSPFEIHDWYEPLLGLVYYYERYDYYERYEYYDDWYDYYRSYDYYESGGPADSGEAKAWRKEGVRQVNVVIAQTKALRSQMRANTEDVMASADLPNGNRLGNQPVDAPNNALVGVGLTATKIGVRGVTVTEGAAIAGGATIADGTVLAGGALGIQVTYGAAVVVSMPVLAPVTFNREKPELFPKPVTSMGNSDAPRPEMGEIIFHGADPDLLDEYYRLRDIDPIGARNILAEANRRGLESGAAFASPIIITSKGRQHVIDRHTIYGSTKFLKKSKFGVGEDLEYLINRGNGVAPTRQPNGRDQRILDAGRIIGFERNTGKNTTVYTVITEPDGTLVTAFPGTP